MRAFTVIKALVRWRRAVSIASEPQRTTDPGAIRLKAGKAFILDDK